MIIAREIAFVLVLPFYCLILMAMQWVMIAHGRQKNFEWLAPGIPLSILSIMRLASIGLGLGSRDPLKAAEMMQSARIDAVLMGPLVLTLVGLLKLG
jgi:hypothetical protein